jgi:hypothetical protein
MHPTQATTWGNPHDDITQPHISISLCKVYLASENCDVIGSIRKGKQSCLEVTNSPTQLFMLLKRQQSRASYLEAIKKQTR